MITIFRPLATIWVLLFAFNASAFPFYQGVYGGYQGDVSGALSFQIPYFSQALPLGLAFSANLAYQWDSGDATAARQIFINDATGGTIEKYGNTASFELDLSWILGESNTLEYSFFAGPRLSLYEGHYAFIGDNEDFTVTHNTFGIGAGLKGDVPIGSDFVLSLKAGVDFFFPSTFEAHGQFIYTPDGVDDNPRNDFTYEDADRAVNQPNWVPRFQIGVLYKLF
jgi:hypothetical protein